MNILQSKTYFNTKPVEFIIKEKFGKLIEDKELIPRFNLKNIRDFDNIPVNEAIKYSESVMIKAINFGMIFLILYKGEKDWLFSGHERVLMPMVIGKSSKGKVLIRAYHLSGWSVSSNRHIQKIWRMFRADRIYSMTFTGSFYRLAPVGYNMNDKGMRGGIIAKADFSVIRKNQQNLINQNVLQNREDISLSSEERKFASIVIKSTDTKLDLNNIKDNSYINNLKNVENYRISFLKSIYGNKYIAILNSLGQTGNTVKVFDDKRNNIGVFKVLDSITSQTLKNIKKVKGNTIFDLYIFDKKI